VILADSANLNGALNITGFAAGIPNTASGLAATQVTLLRTTTGINGDFASVSLGGANSPVDYITLASGVSWV
jgi:hypothetical protein